jgi:hypothetical protein
VSEGILFEKKERTTKWCVHPVEKAKREREGAAIFASSPLLSSLSPYK